MTKKSLVATLFVALMCVFAVPAHAQFGKSLGKSLGKAAKDAGKAVQDVAEDAALEAGANKLSDQIIEFMDKSNTLLGEDSEYTQRLKEVMGSKFTSVDGKTLNVAVYESDEANVIALNNGNIRIYSGMMDVLSDEELQALIALSASQISTKNVRNNLMKAATGENVENATSAQLEKLLSFSGENMGTIVNELVQTPYTEKQNSEADKAAKKYLKDQGLDASLLTDLLSSMQQLNRIDLEGDDLDEEDEDVVKAAAMTKFLKANTAR